MNNIIRILFFVPNLDAGGAEAFIMNMYRNIDKSKFQFDFMVHTNKKGFYEEEILKSGGKIYRLPVKDNKKMIKYIRDLNSFFKEHKEYKIVYGNMPSIGLLYLKVAKHNNIPIRIAHSHSASYNRDIKGILKMITTKLMKYYSTNNFACSNIAGKYMFGKKQYDIIYNAVDIDRFIYNLPKRQEIRKKYNIDNDKKVICHVGRFSKEKNQEFIINLFKKLDDKKFVLLLVGDGKDKKNIEDMVNKYNMKNVIFAGNVKNVEDYYSASDLFILPSLFEGLPTSAVEAQISGLPCVISNNVTKEVKILNDVYFENLIIDKWLDIINNIFTKSVSRTINKRLFENYNIKIQTKNMENRIKDLLNEKGMK